MRIQHTGFGIALKAQHDFRRTVPSCRNIFSHVSRVLLRIHRKASGKSEIADLELAVGVDEEIAGFQIPMQYVRRVDVLQAAKYLIDERLKVSIRERLPRPNNSGQVTFHQLCHASVQVVFMIFSISSPS